MGFDASWQRASEPETVEQIVYVTGNGTSNPTVVAARGVTVTRSALGALTLTFTDYPGNLVGFGATFQATTASQLKTYTCVFGRFDSTGKIIIANISDGTNPQDLTSTQSIAISLTFKRMQLSV